MPRTQILLPHDRKRGSRVWRLVRAVYRDTTVLLREFRLPILVALLTLFAGGWIYRELMVIAGQPRLPYADMPYIMLSLMVLNPVLDLPQEPYLVLFWYVLPMLGLYIVGRGVIDFVGLFFDRTERRNAWEEAVASTYANHVIILGVGHLGLRVIRALVGMGFDVVAIDANIEPGPDEELGQMGVPIIASDGRMPATLINAGLQRARAFIVCTSNDHLNLEITMRARDLNPNVRIVVRMWDDQFAQQIRRFMNVEAVMSASDLAAPSFAGSALNIEITQTLNVGGVDYSMIRLQVESGSFLDGASVGGLQKKYDMDIVLHGHGNNVQVHPHGEAIVRAEDTLVIFAQHNKITDVVARNRSGRTRTKTDEEHTMYAE